MRDRPDISFVSPVYRGEGLVKQLVQEIVYNATQTDLSFEIILVEDGSPDASWLEISKEAQKDERVVGVKLSRNFGQHYAITAGLDLARGDRVIVLDCDLQDRPDQIHKLLERSDEGFAVVFARRKVRTDGFFKKLSSKVFYATFAFLTDTRQDDSIANFGIYDKIVVDSILAMKDKIRYFPTMAQWVGFSRSFVDVEHGTRDVGESSYSWSALMSLAANNIIAFSDKPLRITVKFGLIIAFAAAIVGIYYFISYLAGDISVSGYTSIILSIWFLGGLNIFILGIIGTYLGKLFEQTKDRPVYIIETLLNRKHKQRMLKSQLAL